MAFTNNDQQNKSGKRKWIFLGVGVATAGALSFFGWSYYKKHKKQTETAQDLPDVPAGNEAPKTPSAPKTLPLPADDSFPLRKDSTGTRVMILQEALNAKLGKGALKPDSVMGPKTLAALKKAGYPEVIDEVTYTEIVQGKKKVIPAATGAMFFAAIQQKNFTMALNLLRTLKNTQDYQAASTGFQDYKVDGNVRQTLVNGMLNTFSQPAQKEQIRAEFRRMGLKEKEGKWSLSGLPENLLITIEPTKVWKDPRTSVDVPANMVLGELITERQGYALFENEGQRFLVNRAQVSFYKP